MSRTNEDDHIMLDSATRNQSDGAELPISTPEMRHKADVASDFVKAIANPHRLLILCSLAGARRELSVGELEAILQVRQPTLSQQLARLREDGLVATRRDGKSILYRLDDHRAAILVMLLYDWFCGTSD